MSVKTIFREINNVQNPALGAAIIWRFAVGYSNKSKTSDYPILQLCFLVAPMIFHQETFELLMSTQPRSGLRRSPTNSLNQITSRRTSCWNFIPACPRCEI